jgi:hypothetical protein
MNRPPDFFIPKMIHQNNAANKGCQHKNQHEGKEYKAELLLSTEALFKKPFAHSDNPFAII